ncbi:type II restriction enzyme [Weissella cibaria]
MGVANVRKRKQDVAWRYLFDQFDIPKKIEQNGAYEITSNDINKYVREYYVNLSENAPDARNLLKFDFSSDLPEVFKKAVDKKIFGNDAQFSLMPKGHDRYVISDFKTFENLNYEVIEPVRMTFPKWISGIRPESPETINSEAVAQSVAEMSGMLKYVMDDLNADVVATLSGKKGTGLIDFQISHYRNGQTNFVIDGWQSEIDGVYESPSRVLIVESKKKRPEDFNIRQLYIPTRIYHDQMKLPKEIYSAYFTYTDDVFSFHVYQFTDIDNYNSLQKIREYEFVFEEESQIVNRDTLKSFLIMTEDEILEPRRSNGEFIPFVQANDVEKIFELPAVLTDLSVDDSKNEILELGTLEYLANVFKFDIRQASYYATAAEYFGLVEKTGRSFALTDLGKVFVESDYNTKVRIFSRQLLKRPVFREILEKWILSGSLSTREKIQSDIENHPIHYSGQTLGRRVNSTQKIISWLLIRIE